MTKLETFKQLVWNYYNANKRVLEWREHITAYGVIVSELMLQQTQVPRVQVKFPEFMQKFPTLQSLADASVADVLSVWQGMGYNRRALYLRLIAQELVGKYNGVLPRNTELVDALPGIGPATAAAILAYTYNMPTVFIETNIRRVFIHHFFEDGQEIADAELLPIVEAAVDKDNPREWYYALMDYGTHLAKTVPNPNRRSKHYAVQSKFEGSDRQIRGNIVKMLVAGKELGKEELFNQLNVEESKFERILKDLEKEGFLVADKNKYKLS